MKNHYLIFGLLCFKLASGQNFSTDTSLNQIYILDASSVRLKLKADTSKIDILFASRDSALPDVKIENETGDQLLTMIFHPGDSKYQFSEFKVRYSGERTNDLLTIKIKDKEFITENGITLGANKSDLLSLVGRPTEIRQEKGLEIIEYRITKPDSWILKKYRQAEYFATYKFKADELVEFHFGFVYP